MKKTSSNTVFTGFQVYNIVLNSESLSEKKAKKCVINSIEKNKKDPLLMAELCLVSCPDPLCAPWSGYETRRSPTLHYQSQLKVIMSL